MACKGSSRIGLAQRPRHRPRGGPPERWTGYSTISLPCIQGRITQMNRSVLPAGAVTRAVMTGPSAVIRIESPGRFSPGLPR
jgi:hypothetical protein